MFSSMLPISVFILFTTNIIISLTATSLDTLTSKSVLSSSTRIQSLPSNCISLEDGIHTLQLIDDPYYPSVTLRCSNGYIILDPNLDPNIEKYFSSWAEWHRATVGPSSGDRVDWREWYLPDNGQSSSVHNYLVSPSCNECKYISNRQLYDDRTTYWMTGTFFGCYWRVKANANCDMDYNTLECFTCLTDDRYINDVTGDNSLIINDDSTELEYEYTGLCSHNVRPASYYKPDSQETCTTSRTDTIQSTQNLKPSLGTNGRFCVCAQPDYVDYTEYFTVEIDEEEYINANNDNNILQQHENNQNLLSHHQNVIKTLNKNVASENSAQKEHSGPFANNFLQSAKNAKKISADQISKKNSDSHHTNPNKHTDNVKASKHFDQSTEHHNSNNNIHKFDFPSDNSDLNNNIIELYQSDFLEGTLRITESGYYKIMEDIIFDFNPSNGSPNDKWSYWPLSSQYEKYRGAQDYRDEYSFGFFAGIAIEADYVTIDLNKHKLSMSKYFYHQQPWFTIIELSQQYFLPGQSFGFFGANPHLSRHVIIKNGILGLSSHHGIHGNSNHYVELYNLKIRDFDTHGIQLNGFDNILIKQVDVGPSSSEAYFKGQWGIARVLRRRWQHIADETIGKTIQFYGRDKAVSMQDIVDDLSEFIDYSWNYAVNEFNIVNNANTINDNEDINNLINKKSGLEEFLRDNELDDIVNDLFINPTGIPSAASVYGIFLNKFGASVFTYNLYAKDRAVNAVIEDVSIHGLLHKMDEWPYMIANTYYDEETMTTTTDEIKNPFFGPLSVKSLFNEYPEFNTGIPTYKGDIITDGYIASTHFLKGEANSFKYLGQQCLLNDIMVEWATKHDNPQPPQWDRHLLQTDNINSNSNSNSKIKPFNNNIRHQNEQLDILTMESIHKPLRGLGNSFLMGCNMDTMNHAGKGVLGLRIDSVDNVKIKNINIYDNHDKTPLGSNACGNYDTSSTNNDGTFTIDKTGHFRQTAPMQVGFSGNMNQGIAITASKSVNIEGNININDLSSDTGAVIGIAIWPNVDVKINNANIDISNLEAGGLVDVGKFEYFDRPNKAPEVCGILFYEQYGDYKSFMDISDNTKVNLQCFAGDVGCLGEKNRFAHEKIDDNLSINTKTNINHDECQWRFGDISQKRSNLLEISQDDNNNNINDDNNEIDNNDNNSNDNEKENRNIATFLIKNSKNDISPVWLFIMSAIILASVTIIICCCCGCWTLNVNENNKRMIMNNSNNTEYNIISVDDVDIDRCRSLSSEPGEYQSI